MPTTDKTVKAEADEYAAAYADEGAAAWKPCSGCKTPKACSTMGCQAKKAAELKKAEGK